jgi:hypothetical protein
LYVVKIEKEIFINQIDFVVDNIYDEFDEVGQSIIPPGTETKFKQDLYDYFNTISFPDENEDSIRDQNNQVLDQTKNVVIVIGTILLSIITSLIILRFCTNLSHQFGENIIVLLFMALTEFAFLNLVTKNYISGNPNSVKLYFLQGVAQYANSKI